MRRMNTNTAGARTERRITRAAATETVRTSQPNAPWTTIFQGVRGALTGIADPEAISNKKYRSTIHSVREASMQRIFIPKHHWLLPMLSTAFIILLFGGCASYQSKALPLSTNLSPNVDQLRKLTALPCTAPEKSLSLTEVAIFAVCNNPDLKAQRKQLGIKRAQLFSAGLLPDPQVSANLDHPTGSVPVTANAFGIGMSYDIIPLINRGARVDSAQQAEQQVRLDLLWQEWKVSQRARFLAVSLASERQQIALLEEMRGLYQQRYQRSHKAAARGDLTLGAAGTDLTALLDTLSQINQLEQTCNDTHHALNLLMGLVPDAPLEIRLPPLPRLPDAQALSRELQTLPQRRPDLLALQAGYRSQEATVRAAILSQFPSFSIGITRARDTASLYTTGFNIGLTLPLFSGSSGAIAIERATREQLHEEYQARLDQAAVDVDKLIRLQCIIAAQQKQLNEYLPTLKKLVARGREAYQRGDMDALTFLNMENTWINKRLEQISLDQTQRNNLIALQTLLAIPGNGTPQPADVSEGGKQ
jgi:cobalt-zinc-cadmium efflux system outer membrane protein